MAESGDHSTVWQLARAQHGLVTRAQLLALGYGPAAITHRLGRGRLHPVHRTVYAIGRPQLTRAGEIMAAVLACGPGAAASHETAAEHYGIRRRRSGPVPVSLPSPSRKRFEGIRTHRRSELRPEDTRIHERVPVTSPTLTLIDLAAGLSGRQLLAAVNEADKLDLVDPERLRDEIEGFSRLRGVARLRRALERNTYRMTDSELERRFLPLAERAGLPVPETGEKVNGLKVDFYWPALGLVVETDGLRYHRTPVQQAIDKIRDQTHTRAGMTPLRFSHDQVRFDPRTVEDTLAVVGDRLASGVGRVR